MYFCGVHIDPDGLAWRFQVISSYYSYGLRGAMMYRCPCTVVRTIAGVPRSLPASLPARLPVRGRSAQTIPPQMRFPLPCLSPVNIIPSSPLGVPHQYAPGLPPETPPEPAVWLSVQTTVDQRGCPHHTLSTHTLTVPSLWETEITGVCHNNQHLLPHTHSLIPAQGHIHVDKRERLKNNKSTHYFGH